MNSSFLYLRTRRAPLKNLVGYLTLNGGTVAKVGSNYTANGTGVAYNTGIISQALELSTTNIGWLSGGRANNQTVFTDGTNDLPFSFSMWIYRNTLGGTSQYLFGKSASANFQFGCWIDDTAGNIVFRIYSNNTSGNRMTFTQPYSLLANTWYHLVFSYDGSKTTSGARIYVNNFKYSPIAVITGTYTGIIDNNLADLDIGQNPSSEVLANQFKGRIDEFSIWRYRMLTDAEISILYNNGQGRTYPFI